MKDRRVKEGEPIIINSDRLKVEIAYPGTAYSGSRFDWTGFITQVTLDSRHTFCVPEQYGHGKGSGGIGLCNEFGIKTPVGYDDAGIGEQFPKIGTGLLKRKSGEPYDFFTPYEVEPFPVFVTADGHNACFKVEPLECRGYAVRLEKIVSVDENRLSIGYKLWNTGAKPIFTTEYCHNFMGIDGHNIGKDYCLSFPEKISANRTAGSFNVLDGGFRWDETPEGDFYGTVEAELSDKPWKWQLLYEPSGVGVRETSQFPILNCAVWGSAHVASPELFIEISLKPGETMNWERSYEFFTGAC